MPISNNRISSGSSVNEDADFECYFPTKIIEISKSEFDEKINHYCSDPLNKARLDGEIVNKISSNEQALEFVKIMNDDLMPLLSELSIGGDYAQLAKDLVDNPDSLKNIQKAITGITSIAKNGIGSVLIPLGISVVMTSLGTGCFVATFLANKAEDALVESKKEQHRLIALKGLMANGIVDPWELICKIFYDKSRFDVNKPPKHYEKWKEYRLKNINQWKTPVPKSDFATEEGRNVQDKNLQNLKINFGWNDRQIDIYVSFLAAIYAAEGKNGDAIYLLTEHADWLGDKTDVARLSRIAVLETRTSPEITRDNVSSFTLAIEYSIKYFGEDSEETLGIYKEYSKALTNDKKFDAAEFYQEKALNATGSIYGSNSKEFLLGNCSFAKLKLNSAMNRNYSIDSEKEKKNLEEQDSLLTCNFFTNTSKQRAEISKFFEKKKTTNENCKKVSREEYNKNNYSIYFGPLYKNNRQKYELDEAVSVYKRCINLYLEKSDCDKGAVANLYKDLLSLQVKNCVMDNAEVSTVENIYEKAIELQKDVYGEKNKSYTDFSDDLIETWGKNGNLTDKIAEKYKNEIFEIKKEIFGEDSLELAKSYELIADNWRTFTGKSRIEYYNKSSDIKRKILGIDSLVYIETLEKICHAEKFRKDSYAGDYQKPLSEKFCKEQIELVDKFENLITLKQKQCDSNDLKLADTYFSYGEECKNALNAVYFNPQLSKTERENQENKYFKKTENAFLMSLQIKENHFGPYHINIVDDLLDLGHLYGECSSTNKNGGKFEWLGGYSQSQLEFKGKEYFRRALLISVNAKDRDKTLKSVASLANSMDYDIPFGLGANIQNYTTPVLASALNLSDRISTEYNKSYNLGKVFNNIFDTIKFGNDDWFDFQNKENLNTIIKILNK